MPTTSDPVPSSVILLKWKREWFNQFEKAHSQKEAQKIYEEMLSWPEIIEELRKDFSPLSKAFRHSIKQGWGTVEESLLEIIKRQPEWQEKLRPFLYAPYWDSNGENIKRERVKWDRLIEACKGGYLKGAKEIKEGYTDLGLWTGIFTDRRTDRTAAIEDLFNTAAVYEKKDIMLWLLECTSEIEGSKIEHLLVSVNSFYNDRPESFLFSALCKMAEKRELQVIKSIVELCKKIGGDDWWTKKSGHSSDAILNRAFRYACANSSLEVVQYLEECFPRVEAKNMTLSFLFTSALREAATNGQPEISQYLLSYLEEKGDRYQDFLLKAIERRYVSVEDEQECVSVRDEQGCEASVKKTSFFSQSLSFFNPPVKEGTAEGIEMKEEGAAIEMSR